MNLIVENISIESARVVDKSLASEERNISIFRILFSFFLCHFLHRSIEIEANLIHLLGPPVEQLPAACCPYLVNFTSTSFGIGSSFLHFVAVDEI